MIKQIAMAAICLLCSATLMAKETAGDWQGELQIQPNVSLPLIMHLSQHDGEWQVTIDSPAQQAFGIPGEAERITDTSVSVTFKTIGARYKAKLSNDQLKGTFSQAGSDFSLTLTRKSDNDSESSAAAAPRPQQPQPPFDYQVEEVAYQHVTEGFSFAATLTLPRGKGPFPAAILVSGSGPQDRDETLMGHKPFWVLADHLTSAGIAVLRFDDRGTAQSGGTFAGTTVEGFSTDVASAYAYLQSREDIDASRIGLIGHSEGGVTAPLFAVKQPDVAFMVLLAGLGVDGKTLWAEQQRDIAKAYGSPDSQGIYQIMETVAAQIISGASSDQIRQKLLEAGYDERTANQYVNLLANEWGKSFLTYQPAPVLSKLNMPVLAINGDKDLQVSADSNISAMKRIFADSGNPDVTLRVLPGQNHLFQQADSGLPDEYARISQTIAPETLGLISDWINTKVSE